MQRIPWRDNAKGVGIILVVLGHVLDGLIKAHIAPPSLLNIGIIYVLYLFHIPVFFLLSGLNAHNSFRRSPEQFLVSKIYTIIWPYILWIAIQGCVQAQASQYVNLQANYSDIFNMLWTPPSQFWFLYALMICHVILAICGGGARFMLPFAAIGQILCVIAPPLALKALYNFAFYAVGEIFAQRISDFFNQGRRMWPIFLVSATAFSLLAAALFQADIPYMHPLAAPASFLGVIMTLSLARLMTGRISQAFQKIGAASMTIYVMHIIAAAGTRVILQKSGAPQDPALYIAVCTTVGVVAPMIAQALFERLGLMSFLGLAPPRGLARANAASSL